jgi:FAD/FMN-containing dehydrogenase
VAGYDLTGLFVRFGGTLGIVVGVTVRLKYLPREVTLSQRSTRTSVSLLPVSWQWAGHGCSGHYELLDGRTLTPAG